MFDNPTTKLTNPEALSAATTNAVKNVIDKDIKEANFFGSLIELFNQIKDKLYSEFYYFKVIYYTHGTFYPNTDTSIFEQILLEMLRYNRGIAWVVVSTSLFLVRIIINRFILKTILKKNPNPFNLTKYIGANRNSWLNAYLKRRVLRTERLFNVYLFGLVCFYLLIIICYIYGVNFYVNDLYDYCNLYSIEHLNLKKPEE